MAQKSGVVSPHTHWLMVKTSPLQFRLQILGTLFIAILACSRRPTGMGDAGDVAPGDARMDTGAVDSGTFDARVPDADVSDAQVPDAAREDGCVPRAHYRDMDGDDFGVESSRLMTCDPLSGWVTESGDCNDSSSAIHPGATETCDGLDNNCDSSIDEGCDCVNGSTRTCGSDAGECRPGTQTCSSGRWALCSATGPETEVCDGLDNDCNGSIDNGASCADRANATASCGGGRCIYTCGADFEDCDSSTANGCEANLLSNSSHCGECGNDCGTGSCESGTCVAAGCALEICDGVDNDCDASIDEGCGGAEWCSSSSCEISDIAAPNGRSGHTAVWTGSEMIVWGGSTSRGALRYFLHDGARYSPASNAWAALPTTPLYDRYKHSAVWTGSEMIIWGGKSSTDSYFNDGARYNRAADAWTELHTSGFVARCRHSAIWTGSEMIFWGGTGARSETLDHGARFNPVSHSWANLPSSSAPSPRYDHSAVWTGSEMIVWGGIDNTGTLLRTGARYNLATDTWTTLPSDGPSARRSHTAAWTGSEMIVWGGSSEDATLGTRTGGRYNPSTNTWTGLSFSEIPSARSGHAGVWTGSEIVVWGGYSGLLLNDGARYNPRTDTWTVLSSLSVPSARVGHSAVWTGTDMIVWGGGASGSDLNDGWIWTSP